MAKAKKTAIYCRVSTRDQSQASQRQDLNQWAALQKGKLDWYEDTGTGKTMDRPGMQRLLADVRAGKVDRVVVWRLDRLGRTAGGLVALLEELQARAVNLVSLREGIDLGTPAGRMLANICASFAAYETEVRGERVAAGIAAARAAGRKIGGSKKGRRLRVTEEKEAAVLSMLTAGHGVRSIARVTGLSRSTVYTIQARLDQRNRSR